MGRINLEVVRHLVEETGIDQSGFSGPDGDHQNEGWTVEPQISGGRMSPGSDVAHPEGS